MRDEGKLHTAVQRRGRAEALLRDELLIGSLDAMERDYMKAWCETTAKDADAREQLWHLVYNLRRFRAHLANVVDTGKLAQRDLDELRRGNV